MAPGFKVHALSSVERARVLALAKCIIGAGNALIISGIYGKIQPGEISPSSGAGAWIERFSCRCQEMLDDLAACRWPSGEHVKELRADARALAQSSKGGGK